MKTPDADSLRDIARRAESMSAAELERKKQSRECFVPVHIPALTPVVLSTLPVTPDSPRRAEIPAEGTPETFRG